MNVPIELVEVFMTAMVALQAWILVEIVKLKVKTAGYKDLKKRVEYLESKVLP